MLDYIGISILSICDTIRYILVVLISSHSVMLNRGLLPS